MKFPHYLIALFAVALSASAAAPVVIYQTGWEPSPAVPGWVPGVLEPQNGWSQYNLTPGFQVVSNGTPEASIGGQAIATPYGSQFHIFIASASTTASGYRRAFPDIASALSQLPATHKIFKVSMDFFVPSTQASVDAAMGVFGQHVWGITNSYFNDPWGVLIDPVDRSINIHVDGEVRDDSYEPFIFQYDTWFNVQLTANYNSGAISVSMDGTELPLISQISTNMSKDTLTNVFLIARNWNRNAPPLRSIACDNFLVTAEEDTTPIPSLTIASVPPAAYKLRWPAANAGWILEYTDDFVTGGSIWTRQGAPPQADADPAFVYVNVALGPLHRYFRLRQP